MQPSSLCLQPISTNVEFVACRFIVRKNSRILPDSTRKLLWFEKYISIFGVENGQPRGTDSVPVVSAHFRSPLQRRQRRTEPQPHVALKSSACIF